MAHRRRPLGVALALNTAVLGVEFGTGTATGSLSLIMDSVHNLSDETALAFLLLAYALPAGLSGRLLRSANLCNGVGLLVISAYLVWQSAQRLLTPVPVPSFGPIFAGILGVAGNWGVASALREAAREDAAIKLAYVHNLGDVLLSLGPVLAGILILITGRSLFDPALAFVLGGAIGVTTVRELLAAGGTLIWPENVVCGHAEESCT